MMREVVGLWNDLLDTRASVKALQLDLADAVRRERANGTTLAAIADELGCSRQYVMQLSNLHESDGRDK